MRERMVTRTVTVTLVTALCLHIRTETPELVTYILPGNHGSEGAVLKKLRKEHDTPTFAVCTIQDMRVESRVYGMSEEEFLELATPMEGRFDRL